jgi:DNA modification methylase
VSQDAWVVSLRHPENAVETNFMMKKGDMAMSTQKLEKLYKRLAEAGTPCEQVGNAVLCNEDCIKVMRRLPSNYFDSSVIDGLYGMGRIGEKWNNFSPKAIREATRNHQEGLNHNLQSGRCPSMHAGDYDLSIQGVVRFQEFCYEWAKELYRIMKPGAMLCSFSSPRMYHRMACGIEDAGFEVKDQLQWLFGAGLPKSLDISKSIDKLLGAEREVVCSNPNREGRKNWDGKPKNLTLPASQQAQSWDGWCTGFKSLNEPILLARKPLAEKSVARNVLRYGTGGINVEACRVGDEGATKAVKVIDDNDEKKAKVMSLNKGRLPTNVIIDEEVAEMLKDKAKFYYTAKTNKTERHAGCEHLANGNNHPTVKNISLMEYLVKLVTPKNGVCIDIFAGSGTTGIACSNQNVDFLGVELQAEYYEIAKSRISHWQKINKAA